jgi:hypothetical protein
VVSSAEVPLGKSIRVDLFDQTAHILCEAKAGVTREKICMAVGQLLDYRMFFRPKPTLAVVIPAAPSPDMTAFLNDLGIGAVCPDNEEWIQLSRRT